MAASKKTARATLRLGATQIKSLARNCEEALALLKEHVEVEPFSDESSDRASAEATAKALKGVDQSSDIDWGFSACTLTGADPKGARVKVVKPKAKYGTARVLSDIPDATEETLGDYVSERDQKAYTKTAALLDAAGGVRQLRLTAKEDHGYTVVVTLADGQEGAFGVLTVRSDT
ncbi:Hypothetical protein A7982_04387 [Minicystis rosea]|nr:Hypothetical protein A7982_04387 [Minicystis rosea]